jgi:hypothetical protein
MKYLASLGLLILAGLTNAVSYDYMVTKKLDLFGAFTSPLIPKSIGFPQDSVILMVSIA